MAQNTHIEWTDATWNPLAGCTRASAGCDNCYAAKMSLRLEAMALADIEAGKDPGGKRKYIGIATKNGKGVPAFNGKINLDWDELQRPYSWRKPRRVFVNSMSDLFHRDVPDDFILEAVNVMRDNPAHTFQVLTKRPDRMAEWTSRLGMGLPPNVWAGTSVEDQKTADERIPDLVRVKAGVLFLSMEPLLGAIDLSAWIETKCIACGKSGIGDCHHQDGHSYPCLPPPYSVHWVIVGGESGPNARPMHPDWVRSLRDQCVAAGVAFHFKQWGEYAPAARFHSFVHYCQKAANRDFDRLLGADGFEAKYSHEYEKAVYPLAGMKRVGKKAAGRLLDGREWNEFPVKEVVL